TLGRGMALLEEATANLSAGDMLEGETAFKLYDTYGFPLDLTQDALRARGIGVNLDGFESAMARQRQAARENWTGSGDRAAGAAWFALRD
ncbi:alanine--tRNA ligase, partial [Pseudomonas sp. FW306-2-11AA]|uniref:alanine--tRNA ligase-related protein n=1 Tax=Pseudomonas sp. FW306-2-11AA TaxID=2070663 RepID=UPI000CACD9D9